jgi:hypothetical protein
MLDAVVQEMPPQGCGEAVRPVLREYQGLRYRQRDSRYLLVQALALHSKEGRVQGTGEAGEIVSA